MTRLGLTLLALAALVGLAAALALLRPDDVAMPPAAGVAALPLNLPPPQSAASAIAAPPAAPAPGPGRIAGPAPAANAAPRVGSEGYGPHIEQAQAGSDAAEAWEAVRWLRQCASNEARRNSFENVRNQGVSPELMTQLMVEADAEARRCQTVTAQHRALLPELAARAMRAGVPEAASAYANSVFPGDLGDAQRQEVVDAMRRDAQAGHLLSLLGALMANEAWGLTDAEKLAYLAAYGNLPDHPENKAMAATLLERGSIHFKATPTPEQLAVARQAAQQILDRVRAGKPP